MNLLESLQRNEENATKLLERSSRKLELEKQRREQLAKEKPVIAIPEKENKRPPSPNTNENNRTEYNLDIKSKRHMQMLADLETNVDLVFSY